MMLHAPLVSRIVVILNHLSVGQTHFWSWLSCFSTLLYPSPFLLQLRLTYTISLDMYMSPMNMEALYSLLEAQPKPATNKLILLLMYFTISVA